MDFSIILKISANIESAFKNRICVQKNRQCSNHWNSAGFHPVNQIAGTTYRRFSLFVPQWRFQVIFRVISTASELEANVVSPLRKQVAAVPEADISLAAMIERASNVAKQMRYFGLVTRRALFHELVPSARRAGFALISENAQDKEALFRWGDGKPDFTFLVSFRDPHIRWVVAESLGDIFGLVLTSSSHASTVSVETNLALRQKEFGPNALRFRDVLLIMPGFDDTPAWMKSI
ncbi:hypothetical protein [Bradyrhizobium sp. F1.4.3]|uniref:hypothetical protein n=1 Tax=Bradyrhizobium sp. F1.4.3 TaxID=3156356 RepID=UPI0033919686